MQLVGKFNFLKIEKGQTKPKDGEPCKNYLIVSLLDDNKNSCRFFVFNNELFTKLINSSFNCYQEVIATLDVSYFKENWNVQLQDLVISNGK